MTSVSCNCMVCAKEFNSEELQSVVLSKINSNYFKICQNCFNNCDPADDYRQAREILNSYIKSSEAKKCYAEARSILNSRKL